MGIPLDDALFNARRYPDIWKLCQQIIYTIDNLTISTENGFNTVEGEIENLQDEIDNIVITGGGIAGVSMNGSEVPVIDGIANLGTVVTNVSNKQDILVSGTNIKTINGYSILGSGNLVIQGGGGSGGIEGILMNGSAVTITNNIADLGTVITDISGKQDVINNSNKLPASLVSGLATVATSGNYSDLSGTPGNASTSAYGVTKLSSSHSSTSTSLAATPKAVKDAYDLASSADTAATAAKTVTDAMNFYPTSFGTSNGWTYILFSNKYIHAWRDFNAIMNQGTNDETFSLPFTMADVKYSVIVNCGVWRVNTARNNTYDRTTTTCKIVWNVETGSYGDYEVLNMVLDGYIA